MALTHLSGAASDAMIAVALAGSLFFLDPGSARPKIALYLLLTIAPFAIVTPLIGPFMDRISGGRRTMILITLLARAVLATLLALYIDSFALFPIAFGILVFQKAYSVAKSAIVPKLVSSERDLVEANSKLALLSAVGSFFGASIGGLTLLAGPSWPAKVAVIAFTLTLISAVQLPRITVATTPATQGEKTELRSAGIINAAAAMAVLRASVGFMTFLLAFEFRGGEEGVPMEGTGRASGLAMGVIRDQDVLGTPGAPVWHYGAVLACASGGALLGARIAPRLRKMMVEEKIISGVLFIAFAGTASASWFPSVAGAMVASLVLAVSAGSAKLAFDSLVQRDAPDANHGRSFASFEGRFQLSWAFGSLIALLIAMLPIQVGYFTMALGVGLGLVFYLPRTREARRVEKIITPEEPQKADGQLGFWSRNSEDEN